MHRQVQARVLGTFLLPADVIIFYFSASFFRIAEAKFIEY